MNTSELDYIASLNDTGLFMSFGSGRKVNPVEEQPNTAPAKSEAPNIGRTSYGKQ